MSLRPNKPSFRKRPKKGDESILIDLTTWEVGDDSEAAITPHASTDGSTEASAESTDAGPGDHNTAATETDPPVEPRPRVHEADAPSQDLVGAWRLREASAKRVLDHYHPKSEIGPTPEAVEDAEADPLSDEVHYEWTTENLFSSSKYIEQDWLTRIANPDRIDWTAANPRRVLGLPDNVNWAQVVSAHRSLAKRFHPDANPLASAEEREKNAIRMGLINQAFADLRDERRSASGGHG